MISKPKARHYQQSLNITRPILEYVAAHSTIILYKQQINTLAAGKSQESTQNIAVELLTLINTPHTICETTRKHV